MALKTREVVSIACLLSWFAARAFAVDLHITYQKPELNSLTPPGNDNRSLTASPQVTLGADKKLTIPCQIAAEIGTKKTSKTATLKLRAYFFSSPTPPTIADTNQNAIPDCTVEKGIVSVPDEAKFVVIYTDNTSSGLLSPKGTRGVYVSIDRPVITTPLQGANSNGQTSVTTQPDGNPPRIDWRLTVAALTAAAIAFAISLVNLIYAHGAINALRSRLGVLQEDITGTLDSRFGALRQDLSKLPVQTAVDQLHVGLNVLSSRLDRIEKNFPPAVEPMESLLPSVGRDSRTLELLNWIDALEAALAVWGQTAQAPADRDLDRDMQALKLLKEQVEDSREFDPSCRERFSNCSRTSALKVVFAADTQLDPKRADSRIQSAVAQVVAAARLELVDPPLNSDPHKFRATVISSRVQVRDGGIHGAVALVQCRGLRDGEECVERPQVYVYD